MPAPPAGAQYTAQQRQVSLGAGTLVQVATPNPLRAALLFCGPGGTVTIALDPANLKPVTSGLILPASGYTEFIWERHGPLAQLGWYAVAGTAATLNVIEVAAVPGE